MKTLLSIIISYLFGSVPWGLVIGLVFFHKDIRLEGSGNPGATNAGRVLGKPVAVIVTVLDAIKAVLAMWVTTLLAPDAVIFSGLACCVGHCFPVFAKFKGGKAVATSYGFLLGICIFLTHDWFWGFLFPVLCFFVILYLCKMVSVSSILSLLIAVITSFVRHGDYKISLSLLLLWAFVTYRHKANLERVKNGTESKVTWMG